MSKPPSSIGPSLRVLPGGGQRRPDEALTSRDAVARVLVEAGVDVLLKHITPDRAQEIERRVDRVLLLFDRVDGHLENQTVLSAELDELEALMRQTRQSVRARERR